MPDVIVVGGGPAGAATAITCARAGLDVVVLERRAQCADKPGETLHPGVEPILEQLGVAEAVRAAGFLRHEGIEVTWGGATRFERYGRDGDGPWRGVQAWRSTFENLLLEAVVAHGGSVRRGVGVRDAPRLGDRVVVVNTDAGQIHARWLVDAAGGGHWLGRRLGLRLERLSPKLICWYGYVRRPGGERPSLRGDGSGWTWTAEVKPGLTQWTCLRFDNSRPTSAPVDGEPSGKLRAADVSWRWFPDCAGPGYFLVGDAATVFDPSSSHGVLRALMTGIQAASLILRGEGDQQCGALVARLYRDWLGGWVRSDVTEMQRLYRLLFEALDSQPGPLDRSRSARRVSGLGRSRNDGTIVWPSP